MVKKAEEVIPRIPLAEVTQEKLLWCINPTNLTLHPAIQSLEKAGWMHKFVTLMINTVRWGEESPCGTYTELHARNKNLIFESREEALKVLDELIKESIELLKGTA